MIADKALDYSTYDSHHTEDQMYKSIEMARPATVTVSVHPSPEAPKPTAGLSQELLDSMNVAQMRQENKKALEDIGGVNGLAALTGTDLASGLTSAQVTKMREQFGDNVFPESPMDSFFELLLESLSDPTLIILICAATVSLVIGIITEPGHGWIEGTAIFIAVFLVSNISAGNDYSKQLQFRALEHSSANDDRTSVLREGSIERVNPSEVVVGDVLVLQTGDMIPADCILIDRSIVKANESSLTGEADDIKKSRDTDCFLLSSCLLTEGEDCRALVIGIGLRSQWGKIKANLVTETENTPLQDKLEDMTKLIGKVGTAFAVGTFIALVVTIWTRHGGNNVATGFVNAFIIAVTIIVVAIPEGLPLAVTIALAYSTKKMYQDQCFIRVLSACETMGNATNICSDKTGTLTENRMTVVEGWFADKTLLQDSFDRSQLSSAVVDRIAEQVSINRTAYLVYKDHEGHDLDKPQIIGNKTEGALILMVNSWGFQHETIKSAVYKDGVDKIFQFNSAKKRSTAVVHRSDDSVTIYCKGATEWILNDCTHYLNADGKAIPLTEEKRASLAQHIQHMAERALRTLCLAHKEIAHKSELPGDWTENPPDNSDLILECIVGIIDPLRSDVRDAVRIAQEAGVTVRMVTGDNIATACAIARQCGILTEDGIALEGPNFRKMTPKDVDAVLPKLQVLARSSPDDKLLLVTRLNGAGLPKTREQWESKHKDKAGVTWDADRDRLLPGYAEEWNRTRPLGGQVVGVTGDGTNDAPALKAADVGLAMGITGTKVAQAASDIVILDDKFSSIVKAISWGRCVYDNIRKFLQFQLSVNLVALVLVFISAVLGFEVPLNAVQLLWVNLVMDTMGALALGTEFPTEALLQRKPYKKSASLISYPMWKNIICQSAFQLSLLFVLLYKGAQYFDVPEGYACKEYHVDQAETALWDLNTREISSTTGTFSCSNFITYCPGNNRGTQCFEKERLLTAGGVSATLAISQLEGFADTCLSCTKTDYRHYSIIFNAFIFCQLFNELNSRSIDHKWNVFKGVITNHIFILVWIVTIGFQIFLIEIGDEFVKTAPLTWDQWLITVGLGAISLVIGVLMRFIPIEEDPNSFFDNSKDNAVHELPPAKA